MVQIIAYKKTCFLLISCLLNLINPSLHLKKFLSNEIFPKLNKQNLFTAAVFELKRL